MPTITRNLPVRTDIDGLAILGMTPNDVRGIRYEETTEGNVAGTTTGAAAGAGTVDATTSGSVTTDTAATTAPNVWDGKIESLDPAAQKIITDLRKEAGDNRVKATTADQKLQAILKAAGVGAEEPDPAALLATAQTTAANAARELAVFKAANGIADPTKLLDRTSFITSIAGIDPTDGPALKAAIEAAVSADASLKAARAAGASSVDTSGGTGEIGQITETQLEQMTPEQIAAAYEKGQLIHLL